MSTLTTVVLSCRGRHLSLTLTAPVAMAHVPEGMGIARVVPEVWGMRRSRNNVMTRRGAKMPDGVEVATLATMLMPVASAPRVSRASVPAAGSTTVELEACPLLCLYP